MRPMYVLSPCKSDFLNLVRWLAALVVVMGLFPSYGRNFLCCIFCSSHLLDVAKMSEFKSYDTFFN